MRVTGLASGVAPEYAPLTAEEEEAVRRFVWDADAPPHSTTPADRSAAESAMRSVYRRAGLEPPRTIAWATSPRAGVILADRWYGENKTCLYGPIEEAVLRWLIRADANEGSKLEVGLRIRPRLPQPESFDPPSSRKMEAWFTASQAANLERSLWLSREAAWWPRPPLGRFLAAPSIGDAFLRMARSADPWWWPFRDEAILTERPTILCRDPEGRLHAPGGPAIAWSDGFGLRAWHGVRVSQAIVAGDFGLAAIDAEEHEDVRWAMVECYGYERFLRDSSAEEVGRDEWGRLWRHQALDGADIRVVEVLAPTPESPGSARGEFGCVPSAFDNGAGTVDLTVRDYIRLKDYSRRTVPRTPRWAIAWLSGLPAEVTPERSETERDALRELEHHDWYLVPPAEKARRGRWWADERIEVYSSPGWAGRGDWNQEIWRVEGRDFLARQEREPHETHAQHCRRVKFIERLPTGAFLGPRARLIQQVYGVLRVSMTHEQAAAMATIPLDRTLDETVTARSREVGLEGEANHARAAAQFAVAYRAEDLGAAAQTDCIPALWAFQLDEPWETAQAHAGTLAKALCVSEFLDPSLLAAALRPWGTAFPDQPLELAPAPGPRHLPG